MGPGAGRVGLYARLYMEVRGPPGRAEDGSTPPPHTHTTKPQPQPTSPNPSDYWTTSPTRPTLRHPRREPLVAGPSNPRTNLSQFFPNLTQPDPTRPNPSQPVPTRPNPSQPVPTRPNPSQPCGPSLASSRWSTPGRWCTSASTPLHTLHTTPHPSKPLHTPPHPSTPVHTPPHPSTPRREPLVAGQPLDAGLHRRHLLPGARNKPFFPFPFSSSFRCAQYDAPVPAHDAEVHGATRGA